MKRSMLLTKEDARYLCQNRIVSHSWVSCECWKYTLMIDRIVLVDKKCMCGYRDCSYSSRILVIDDTRKSTSYSSLPIDSLLLEKPSVALVQFVTTQHLMITWKSISISIPNEIQIWQKHWNELLSALVEREMEKTGENHSLRGALGDLVVLAILRIEPSDTLAARRTRMIFVENRAAFFVRR